MKKISRTRRGLCICIVLYVLSCLSIFILCENVSYRYIFNEKITALESNAQVSADSFSEEVSDNLNSMSEVANDLAGFNSLQSYEALNMLRIAEMNTTYSGLSILYSDGIIVNSQGEATQADSGMIAEVFDNRYGVSMVSELRGNNENNLIVYVPIVDGKTELIGSIDLLSTAKFISAANTNLTRIILFESDEGRIILDADKRVVNDNYLPYNLYNYLNNIEFTDDYSMNDMMKNIGKGQSGYAGVKSGDNNQVNFISYAPVGYNDWYLVLVMPNEIINNAVAEFHGHIRIIFAIVSVIFLVLLLLMFYIIRRNCKKDEEERIKLLHLNLENEVRSRFFAEVSHELKTPLNAMVGMMDLCEINADNSERVKECIAAQRTAGEQLAAIIDDMLDIEPYDGNQEHSNEKEFNLGKQLHELVTLGSARIREKNINFKITLFNLEHENVIGDERRLNRVLLNVIDNAGNTVGENGSINICLAENKTDEYNVSEYIYTIADTGSGSAGFGMEIAREMVEKMGGEFVSESDPESGNRIIIKFIMNIAEAEDNALYTDVLKKYKDQIVIIVDDDEALLDWMKHMIDSVGMKAVCYNDVFSAMAGIEKLYSDNKRASLMIFGWKMPGMSGAQLAVKVRRIAGKDVPIIIQTSYEHEETDFDIHLAAVNKVMVEPIFCSEFLGVLKDMDTESESGRKAFPDFSRNRILLVDDHRANVKMMEEYLTYTGAQVDTVYDGTDALDMFLEKGEGYYDIILMDVRMPRMDGYEAARRIRGMNSDYAKNIPIIALSANAFFEDRKKSKEAGMNSHLAKPVKYYEVYDELEKWLKR